jgi:sirohydrochlorin cobaltochelatase
MTGTPGLILFAHGARDPRWAEPFERIRNRVAQLRPDVATRLAYLELMRPDLPAAVSQLANLGCTDIRIAPVFFGQGGHIRKDLPLLMQALHRDFPGLRFTVLPAAGEDDAVCDAVAAFCIDGL